MEDMIQGLVWALWIVGAGSVVLIVWGIWCLTMYKTLPSKVELGALLFGAGVGMLAVSVGVGLVLRCR